MTNMVERVRGRIGDRPARLAFRFSNTPPVRRMLARRYDAALAGYRDSLPNLAGIDLDVVAGLQRDGIFVTSLDAINIPGSADMLRAAREIAEASADEMRAQSRAGRTYTIAPGDALVRRPEIFRWGVGDRLLDIADAYIGLPTAYDGVNLIYTVADGRVAATREWHRDREDRRMVKIAVYCNDVGPGDGPFQMLRRADASQNDSDGYRYVYGSPDLFARKFGADYERDIVTCEGAAGTVIFTDTARYFHRGEPPVANDRKALFFSYFSRRTRHPYFCARSGLTPRQLQMMAAGMPPRQRESILWRNHLNPVVRLIPPAPM